MLPSFSAPYEVNRKKYRQHGSTRCNGPKKPFIELRRITHPWLFKCGRKVLHCETILARVDTGADITVLTQDAASKWSLDLKRCSQRDVQIVRLADGSIRWGVVQNVSLDICGIALTDVPVFISAPECTAVQERQLDECLDRLEKRVNSGVMDIPSGAGGSNRPLLHNLLGTRGVLDRVLLCIDSERVYLYA